MKKLVLSLTLIATMVLFQSNSKACTDFRLTAKDGSVLITRSMEFAQDLKSNLRTSTRNRTFSTTTPNNQPGLAWKAKYGYVYLDGMNQDFALDGMNETGLSFEYLYLPGETQYQTVPAGKDASALPYFYLGDYILGNFKSVDEVRKVLPSLYVFQQTLPGLGNMVFPVHAAIFEQSGKGIVVEFINGQMTISDNIGVMTNSPRYGWHVTDLRNYVNLSPYNPKPITQNGMTFPATGQGGGMVGLPGDISPPSRFAKTAILANTVYQGANAAEEINVAEHIINNVDIPLGLARAKTNGQEVSELTQWVVFKDLTHRMFYYRTYNNMTMRSIDLSKLDFAEKATRLKAPIAGAPNIVDMTPNFLNAKMQ